MRFWVTKNGELSVREQLVRQVILAILSDDMPPGQKLPSTRAIARRYKIHANTVSSAYHHLLEQGWLELRRGSGLYVRANRAPAELDQLLARVLTDASKLGHQPETVLQRFEQLIRPRRYEGIRIAEPDPAMRAILEAELGIATSDGSNTLLVALQTRAVPGSFVLRLRSVSGSLEGQARPPANAILTLVSASGEFRQWARTFLIAVGIEPDCLNDVDTSIDGWKDRVRPGMVAIADIVAARSLPAGCLVKPFRVIADSSIAEVKQMLQM